jgi:hypothetical protein
MSNGLGLPRSISAEILHILHGVNSQNLSLLEKCRTESLR